MISNPEPKLIICDGAKIYKPKAKKLASSINIQTVSKRQLYHNPPCKTPISRLSFNDLNIKNYWKSSIIPNNNNDLSLISFEEIENDFKNIKKRNEMNKVEKELIGLIKKSTNNTQLNDKNEMYERAENQFYKNFENNK